MVELHVYGELRRYAAETRADGESVVRLLPGPDETLRSVLEKIGIPPEDLYHVFLNGALVSSRNSMAPWLEYRETDGGGLDTPIGDGDRLGLFARDMALLVV